MMIEEEKNIILKEVIRLLSEKYINGLYDFLYNSRFNVYRELLEIEEKINRSFVSDTVSLKEFKSLLRDYWVVHIKAIKELKIQKK
ncbi:MAG: hypothetical protein KatS3mg087_1720 [Patescibacteria group bacterium]|nr:MAG: hypothetical protein KatS3mg087_1720 [Patescibacteria group bacterium]